jgi:glycosyltransferase involved in cell wall biosynthesis
MGQSGERNPIRLPGAGGLNIVLDARTVHLHFPGIGRTTYHLARAIARSMAKNERLFLLRAMSRLSYWDLDELTVYGATIVDVPYSPFSLQQQWSIPLLLRRLGASVYHSPYHMMPFWPRVPTTVTINDLIPLTCPQYSTFRARRLSFLTLSLALRTALQVITLSQSTKRDLHHTWHLSPERVQVIYPGVAPSFSPQSPLEIEGMRSRSGLDGDYVLYVGSNKPHKNLLRLLKAWSMVTSLYSRARRRTTLVIAGSWDRKYQSPRVLSDGLDAFASVRFLGPVSEADLIALYSGAKFFVFPSLYEGFGLPPLEAMACGSPVACSNTASLPEVVGEAAVTFDPTNVRAIAAAIGLLLEDQDLRQALRERGLEQARRFTWEDTARQTLECYRTICGGGL